MVKMLVAIALLAGCYELSDVQEFPCAEDKTCPSPFTCIAGQCVHACTAGEAQNECRDTCTELGNTYCPRVNNCADLQTDDEHCGSCDTKCTNGTACSNGACVSNLTLGRSCMTDADCPSTAPTCQNVVLSTGATSKGFCSMTCLEGITTTTNSSGNFSFATPASADQICADAYEARGHGRCNLVTAWSPMDNPIKPNKSYTNVELSCLVECETADDCAFGMRCDVSNNVCVPL